MDKEKVKAIKEWEAPTKVSELRSFLGLANYYRRFIKGYSAKAAPLTDLLKKGKTWEWSKRYQSAFEGLKEAVTEEPVLALPDHTKVFELQTDASDFAIGGVLMQERHPIAFESRKLNDTERRYTVQEKEMTAVVLCLRMWRHYLLGSRFLIKTDNIATSYFQSQRKLSPKQARWQDFLAEFDYMMESEATNQSPFEIAIGQQPLTPLTLAGDYKGRSPLAAQVARSWNEQADMARSYLDKVGRKMKKWVDKRRRPKDYNLGDMVMLKLLAQQFKSFKKVHKGLIQKYEGPFPIVAKVGKASYRLELPPKLKIHPIFHDSLLKPRYIRLRKYLVGDFASSCVLCLESGVGSDRIIKKTTEKRLQQSNNGQRKGDVWLGAIVMEDVARSEKGETPGNSRNRWLGKNHRHTTGREITTGRMKRY
ncbi:hypothetical protein RJ639_019648 [Escallonia herrerae]|uniref:Reverse transcriptase/retrotransposon-derived protein RNase H-like domain-containing protein n=1 Tax=Escallonia herrerae TaxID=1293975 RepID=A0AA89AJH8_9ASTE|nr:hypothetical protein RJ639_019648 [Escallonia herrerae]